MLSVFDAERNAVGEDVRANHFFKLGCPLAERREPPGA
jgi:hypothetical protein